MTEDHNLNVSKKLSPESLKLLEEFTELSIKGANLVPKLYSSLSKDGLPHQEILNLIEERLDIGRRRLYQLLAPEQKRSFTKKKVKQIALSKEGNRRLVVPEEPVIPPPPEVVREAEIVREPPKPVNEPISIPQRIVKIMFDPAPIDRDRTQVFIIHYDVSTSTIKKYETVGRRTLKR